MSGTSGQHEPVTKAREVLAPFASDAHVGGHGTNGNGTNGTSSGRREVSTTSTGPDLWRAVFERAGDPIVVLDADQGIVEANEEAVALFAVAHEQLLHARLADLLVPVGDGPVEDDWSTLLRDGELLVTRQVATSVEASVVEVHARAHVVPGRHVAIIRDITDAVSRAKALVDREVALREVFEHAGLGTAIVSLDGELVDVNPALCALLGRNRDDLLGRSVQEFTDVDDREEDRESLQAVLEGRMPMATAEKRFVLPTGGVRWVRTTTSAVRGADGAPFRFILHVDDVGDRRKEEDRRREASRLDVMARLSGGSGHELNNVLTVIIGHADMLGPAVVDKPAAVHSLEVIRSSSRRAANLAKDLLRIGAQQLSRPERFELERRLAALQPGLADLAGERVSVRLAPEAPPGWVEIDPAQLDAVMEELVANARDASPDGGHIAIATWSDEHWREHRGVAAEPRGRPAMRWLTVTDNGHGMDQRIKAQALQPFFTTLPRRDARGLGLAAVHGIVHQAGGVLDIDSTPAVGTTVVIGLPVSVEVPVAAHVWAPPAAAEAVLPPPTPAARRARTVLLVDDEEAVLRLLEMTVRKGGHDVLAASSGEQALDLVAQTGIGRIDLVVADVSMPGMKGPQLAEQLRAQRPDLPVLFMSGYAEDALTRNGILPEGVRLLAKPFLPADMLAEIGRMLGAPSSTGR